jgi:uncharacterized repeat protein (TIGR03803 family)
MLIPGCCASNRGVLAVRRSLVLSLLSMMCIAASFMPASAQTYTTLHSFANSPDGASPFGGLVADAKGNFYGTTQYGGTLYGGTVFELSPPAMVGGDWTETVIWNFAGGLTGNTPSYQLVMDAKGNLYGEVQSGGNPFCSCGGVFVLVPPKTSGGNWSERIIYAPASAGGNSGSDVFYGGLILDASGAVYGTQFGGGTNSQGLAFKIAPVAGGGFRETDLYNFGGASTDSMQPWGPLTLDASGNLYGVSLLGGASGNGTAYKLTPPAGGSGAWNNTILYSFPGGSGGCQPEGNVILDKGGKVYGQTTACGGSANRGIIFRLTPPTGSGSWTESVLHTFSSTDGGGLYPSLALNAKTNVFYGTSFYAGVVFELKPPAGGSGRWIEEVLATTTFPLGPVVWDANGTLYGTAYSGGSSASGTAFSIAP